MKPIFAKGNKRTIENLIQIKKEAQKENQYRVAIRIHAVILSLEGHTSGSISNILKADRSRVTEWINNWNKYKLDGLLEGHRCGRSSRLSGNNKEALQDIIESGPVAYGLNTGVWTSPIITEVIKDEFDVQYHPGHVRKLLKTLGFSFQRPTYKLMEADSQKRNKWTRYTYPRLKKTLKQKMP